MSPGVQLSVSQMAASVEKRIALTLLFLIFDRFTLEMPTFSASWLRDICRSAIMTSNRKIIFPISVAHRSNQTVCVSLQLHSVGEKLGEAEHADSQSNSLG